MNLFLGQLVNGIMLGGLYALVAVAYTLIFGVLRIVYFAQGQVMMIGAYAGLVVLLVVPSIPIALAAACIVGAALGFVIERVAVRPLAGRHHLMPLVTTVSVGVILEELVRLGVARGFSVAYPPAVLAQGQIVRFGLVTASSMQFGVFLAAAGLMAALTLLINRSWYGRAIRSVAADRDVAALLGVNLNRVTSATFALSSALTAGAGVLFGLTYSTIDPYFGGIIGFKALAVVLFGGLGSLTGAGLAGLVLGITEAMAAAYLPTSYLDAFAFGTMMLVILVRPGGLVSVAASER